MRENTVKTKLRKGEAAIGILAPNTDPAIAEAIGLLGFDFYMMDAEHGPITVTEAATLVRACESVGTIPLARVRSLDPKLILQFLDVGVMGVMMPGARHAADVRALVEAIKYQPQGRRGLAPVRSSDYLLGPMSQPDYVAFANDQTLVLPQIEDLNAVPNLPEMVKVPGVDGFIIGPRDLSMSMGFTDWPLRSEVKAVIDGLYDVILGAGLVAGTTAVSGEAARGVLQRGGRLVLGSVNGLLAAASKEFLKVARS